MTTPKKKARGSGEAEAPKAVMETRVFKSGNSYAVRIPKPLYEGGEGAVYMRKLDNGTLVITAKRKRTWPVGFFESFGNLPSDFEAPERPVSGANAEARARSLFDEE